MVATMTPVPRHTRRQRAFVPGTTIDAFKASPATLKAATTFTGIVKRSGVNLFGFDLTDDRERKSAIALIAHVSALKAHDYTDSDLTQCFGLNATAADRIRIALFETVEAQWRGILRDLSAILGPTHTRELLTAATMGGR